MIDNNRLTNRLYNAVVAKFQSQKLEALARIENMLFNSVIIADHSNIVEDMCAAARDLSEAEEVLNCLSRNLTMTDKQTKEDN